jgi:uncharacterized protein (TIGR00730 family)
VRLCFLGSGMEDARERLRGIEVGAIADAVRPRFGTLVFGGSRDGFMGAFASAFAERGGRLVAVVPAWLRDLDLVHPGAEAMLCADLAERKRLMFEDIDAVLCYPGGIGTWDELFDLLARRAIDLHVLQRVPCPPVYVYNWEQFYAPLLLQLETATEAGLIHPETVAMVRPFTSVDALRGILAAEGPP